MIMIKKRNLRTFIEVLTLRLPRTFYKNSLIVVIVLPTAYINSLPNDKILDLTRLKAFADDKLDVAKLTISHHNRVENTVGKGENASYRYFLLFPQCFFQNLLL